MVNILLGMAGGKPRGDLYSESRQEHKALIPVEKCTRIIDYSYKIIAECRNFDRIFVSAPLEALDALVKPEYLKIMGIESGQNLMGSIFNCWQVMSKECPEVLNPAHKSHITIFLMDSIFATPQTIDDFFVRASQTEQTAHEFSYCAPSATGEMLEHKIKVTEPANAYRDVIAQVLPKQFFPEDSTKEPRFIPLRDIGASITTTNLFQVNIVSEKTVASLKNLLFKKYMNSFGEEYYTMQGKGAFGFYAAAFKAAARQLGPFTAFYILANSAYRQRFNRLEERFVRNVSRLTLGLDLGYVFSTNWLDAFDIDDAGQLAEARTLLAYEAAKRQSL